MRATRAEISLTSIKNNLEAIKNKIGNNVTIMGIVKANAYGHGLIETSKALANLNIDYLGVGFLEEGMALRQNGIQTPILVMGGVLGEQVQHFLANNLEITVSSIEIAERIEKDVRDGSSQKAKVHLKIDTGMERIGVHSKNALQFVEKVANLKNIEIVGIYSHFATSDEKDKSFTYEQLDRFNNVLKQIRSIGIEIPFKHIANSGAILDIPESYFNMVRPGILIYGIYPSNDISKTINVTPSLTIKSKIVFVKTVEANTSISYGRKFFTKSKTKIATIPIGYGDGYNRKLINKAKVVINNKPYPVVGAICMDQIMVDIGNEADIHVGDDVTILGNDHWTSVSTLAEQTGTNVYEILCGISARVPRVYI